MLAGLLAGGCGPSVWQAGFEPTSATAAQREKDAPVQIREVPWETLDRALREIQAEVIASEVHPDDWPAERKLAARATLLKGLQVSGDPATIEARCRAREVWFPDLPPSVAGNLSALVRDAGDASDVVAWLHAASEVYWTGFCVDLDPASPTGAAVVEAANRRLLATAMR